MMRGVFLTSRIAAVFLTLIALLFCAACVSPARPASSDPAAETCRAYLSACGWDVSFPPEESNVTVPETWGAVYLSYNELQRLQGFDLAPYKGKTLRKLVFTVLNYPGAPAGETVLATCFVYSGRLVGGDICCPRPDGFMHGLRMEGFYADDAP